MKASLNNMNNNNPWKKDFIDLLSSNQINEAQNLKFQHLPRSLFKYRGVDDFSVRNLLNNSLWAASADTFNDPFDSFFMLSEKILELAVWQQTKERIKISLAGMSQPIFSAYDVDQAKSISELMELAAQKNLNVSVGLVKNLEDSWRQFYANFSVNELRPKIQASMGICSLSEVNSSMIMWKYYGCNHSGFCIEYDLVETQKDDAQILHAVHPVMYVDQLPDMAPLMVVKNPLLAVVAALHKSSEWSHEKEWRFVFPFGSRQVPFEMRAPKVKAIYLGQSIDLVNKNRLIQIASHKKIAVYEMYFFSNSYQLGSKKIEI